VKPLEHWIPGEKPHKDDGTPLHEGYIAIQAESHPTEFKTIAYMPLKRGGSVFGRRLEAGTKNG